MVSRTLQERIQHTRRLQAGEKRYQYILHLKNKYGITPEEKIEMALKQEYKCANLRCKKHLGWQVSRIAVDHCHKTGKVRALLCTGCNTTLGHLEIEDERLKGLHEYIERYKVTDPDVK